MYKEIEEFEAYTRKPDYRSTGKRDTGWLGRFTFRTLLDFEGMGRILTIIARGYLYQGDVDPYDNIDYARNALKAWCSVPEKNKKSPGNRDRGPSELRLPVHSVSGAGG